jgi:hypothetical protein
MGDKLKSAYELALEKLARKERGSTPSKSLTAGQKKRIAAIRQECQAKRAEREILFQSERRSARGDIDQISKIEEAYRRDRERLLAREEERIREVRSERDSEES